MAKQLKKKSAKKKSRAASATKVRKTRATKGLATTRKKSGTVTRGGRGGRRSDVQRDMDGGYRTCGGFCPDPKPRPDPADPMGERKVWCDAKCSGDVAEGCRCRLYSYPTPAPGDDPPPMKDWKKESDDRIVPDKNKTYRCVCVKKK